MARSSRLRAWAMSFAGRPRRRKIWKYLSGRNASPPKLEEALGATIRIFGGTTHSDLIAWSNRTAYPYEPVGDCSLFLFSYTAP